jgi:hypothetical protein
MSRCVCCDASLTEWELRRKDNHGQFKDTCSKCQKFVDYYDRDMPEDDITFIPEYQPTRRNSDEY